FVEHESRWTQSGPLCQPLLGVGAEGHVAGAMVDPDAPRAIRPLLRLPCGCFSPRAEAPRILPAVLVPQPDLVDVAVSLARPFLDAQPLPPRPPPRRCWLCASARPKSEQAPARRSSRPRVHWGGR